MKIFFLLFMSSVCAAFGQIFLKKGASSLFNLELGFGLALYTVGFVLWVYCLGKVSLTVVYAFTLITFILVFLLANLFFNEKITVLSVIGIALVFLGFSFIAKGQSGI
ncbi:hypothetical protein ACVBEE_08585 [Acinetobacter sp. ANC 3781]